MSIMLLGIFFTLSLLGIPLAISLGLSVAVTIVMFDLSLALIARLMYTSMNSYLLVAIPLFILAGAIMEKGGVSNYIFNAANAVVGRWRGGLGHVNIIASMIFGGISGSSIADVASLGALEIKAMTEHKYPKPYSAAVTMVTSTLASIVPPSILMIIAAVSAEQSVGKALAGGLGPAMLLVLMFMGLNYFLSVRNGYGDSITMTAKEVLYSIITAIPALFSPLIILGGIFLGFVTPTEGAAVAVFYTLIISTFIYRPISWKEFSKITIKTGKMTGTILLIAMTAAIVTYIFTIDQLPAKASNVILSFSQNPRIVLLLMGAVFIIIGMFMDIIAAILLLTPVLMPTAVAVGVDPIHFVVFMVASLAIGLSTPPVGVCLFASSVVSNLKVETIIKAAVPYYIIMFIFVIIIALFPNITLCFVKVLM